MSGNLRFLFFAPGAVSAWRVASGEPDRMIFPPRIIVFHLPDGSLYEGFSHWEGVI